MSAGTLLQASETEVGQANPRTPAERASVTLAPQPVAPLASAVQAILSEDAPASLRVDPADVLAMTLDLAGSVRIDAYLSGDADLSRHSPRPSPESRTGEAVRELEPELLDRFQLLEAPVLRRLHAIPSGRSRIWDAQRVHAELTSRGVFDRRGLRGGRAARSIARSACESYLLCVAGCLDRIRAEVRALRSDMGPHIAALGSCAAQIEAFDSLLAHARSRFNGQLFSRIPPALTERFEERFLAALKILPASQGAEALAEWYLPGGWVAEFQERAIGLVAAALQYEWEGLLGLVRAAREEESVQRSSSRASLEE